MTLPDWLGKQAVSDDPKEGMIQALELINCWNENCGKIVDTTNLRGWADPQRFIETAMPLCQKLQEYTDIKFIYKNGNTAIWVGFPKTPIGEVNAQLVSVLFHYFGEEDETNRSNE